MVLSQTLNNHRILKRLAKALISLRLCAGWSEPLLVAYTILLEISCTGSFVFDIFLAKTKDASLKSMTKSLIALKSIYINMCACFHAAYFNIPECIR